MSGGRAAPSARRASIASALRRLGGPDAVTWPAFWISFVMNLLGNITTGGPMAISWPLRITLLAVSQIVMFIPLVAVRRIFLSDPDRPRPVIGISALVLAPMLRGLTFAVLLMVFAPSVEPNIAYRVFSGASNLSIILIITALAVGSLREHRRRLESLLALRTDLEESRRAAESMVMERNLEVVERLQSVLQRELDSIDAQRPERAAQSLERMASEVVRPLAHEMAGSLSAWQPPPPDPQRSRVSVRQVVEAMLIGAPYRPVVSAVLLGILVLFTIMSLYGPAVGFFLLVAEFIIVPTFLAAGNAVFAHLPPDRGRIARTLLLILFPALAAVGMSATILVALDGRAMQTSLVIAALVFVPIISLLLAVDRAARSQQSRVEVEIEISTDLLNRSLVRLHQVQWFQQKALSRALHGPVQSSVTAAVRQLRGAADGSDIDHEAIASIRATLLEVIDVLNTPQPLISDLDEALARVEGLWGAICSVRIDLHDQVRPRLLDDPVGQSCVIDLLTEAMSNAVRHGDATSLTVDLVMVGNDLSMTVTDDGSGDGSGPSSGLGTRQLDECTLSWSRERHGDQHRLWALVPIG